MKRFVFFLVSTSLFFVGGVPARAWARGHRTISPTAAPTPGSPTATPTPGSPTATPTPGPTTGSAVSFASPVNGQTVSGSVTAVFAIPSTPSTTDPTSVWWTRLSVDGTPVAYGYNNLSWNSATVADGSHQLTVDGYAFSSSTSIGSASISVNVNNAVATIVIAAPPPGATVSNTVPVMVQVASSVSSDNLYVDSKYAASGPPYTYYWDSTKVPNGGHILSANAYSSSGVMLGNNAVNVTVNNLSASPLPTPTATRAPTPSATPTPVGHFSTLPPGAALPTGAQCAAQIPYNSWEPRPGNATANATLPTAAQLSSFYANPLPWNGGPPISSFAAVDGNYSGSPTPTTDMIMRWEACKWGVDEDVVRAQAVAESSWSQSATGDWDGSVYASLGLMQVRCNGVTASFNNYPECQTSTPFNVDFRGFWWRMCMNGQEPYLTGNANPATGNVYPRYSSTDEIFWGCVGSWFSGDWYSPGAINYINNVKTIVGQKPWLQPGF